MRVAILLVLAAFSGATAFAQQVAFTSRTYVQSPVLIVSFDQSKEFGFESITLRNDGRGPITAVHFLITLRTEAGDEVADERRGAVDLNRQDTRTVPIGLADIKALKQQTLSRNQKSALAILTIESVEFADGSEWRESEREQGAPIDPLVPAK